LESAFLEFGGFAFIGGLMLVAGGWFFARRNLRMGRGDRRGATRLAFIIFALAGIAWVFGEHHVAAFGEFYQFVGSTALMLLLAALVWLMYIALEPFMRRHSPGLLIGWSRLLAGGFRDPLVGRDLLVGCVAGIAMVLVSYLRFPLARLIHAPQFRPSGSLLFALEGIGSLKGLLYLFSGTPAIVSWIFGVLLMCIIQGCGFSFAVFLLRVLLKRMWVVATVLILFVILGNISMGQPSILASILIALAIGIDLFVYFRFGMLAYVIQIFAFSLLLGFPITTQLSAWYSGIGLTGLVLLLAFALYAFHTSLGGQPLFGRASLED
jgi:serine/threonine-protein kinase